MRNCTLPVYGIIGLRHHLSIVCNNITPKVVHWLYFGRYLPKVVLKNESVDSYTKYDHQIDCT